MKRSQMDGPFEAGRSLNTVALQNAVLCADCDVVSDSPHDRCLVCGSRSLFNIARMFGGTSQSPRQCDRQTTAGNIATRDCADFPGARQNPKEGDWVGVPNTAMVLEGSGK
jgi:hypothetical protein